jgi:SAM-dependent methyltransferase
MTDPAFRTDLYRGTALAYDRFRRPYPAQLIADLIARTGADGTGADGTGRLLDLACGTGQVAFALARSFAEVWAVDQEPEMIEVAKDKADRSGMAGQFRFVTDSAEDLAVPREHFDLVTIGNAFHRLPRVAVAAAVLDWLRPGGFLALLWGGSPNLGAAPWQRALTATMERWQQRLGADERIPAGWQQARDARPDAEILAGAGFEVVGAFSFPFSYAWTADELAGYVSSTSILSAEALGQHAADFDADLRRELSACQPDGRFSQEDVVSYDLARRPASQRSNQ